MNAVVQPVSGIRPMRYEDLGVVMSIERRAYDYPWTEGIFRDCIRVGYSCSILENKGIIVAYGVMSVAGDESHILNLCVRPEAQRQGYGRIMLGHMISLARRHKAELVLLEVRPSNRRAISLYHGTGFNEVGTRKAYYPGPQGREDALILALSI